LYGIQEYATNLKAENFFDFINVVPTLLNPPYRKILNETQLDEVRKCLLELMIQHKKYSKVLWAMIMHCAAEKVRILMNFP